MRVIVSGSHGSGKSTLISDFALSHPDWEVLPDPYEFVDLDAGEPSVPLFIEQLRIAAARMREPSVGHLIAERGPLDFLAYLHAMETLGRSTLPRELTEWGYDLTRLVMTEVDLLVVLPLNRVDALSIGDDEDRELRDAMNMALLELADDRHLTGRAAVTEIVGSRDERLASLRLAIRQAR
jgi:hypothetical protein